MEKREQRARRDRRRDGKRNTFQNDQGKETGKQQDYPVEKKRNDIQNDEASNKKSTSEDKDKTIEDDPMRFANLKRETDEIAALKARKPHKRQVFSNWSKYEEPFPIQDESRAVDFESLLHAPQSGGFRFKSEQQWDTGSYGRFGELFTPDAELLVGGLTSLPLYERLGTDVTSFSEDEIERMESCAKANSIAYEKLSKSKPKPKVAATDLFKIDQAEKYSVMDQGNGVTVKLDTSTNKPVFSVEESPEAPPAELSLPARAVGSSAEPSVPRSESTPATECGPEGSLRDFHFGKPPQPSHGAAENLDSQIPGEERTSVRDCDRGTALSELSFERAPPPSNPSGNRKSPFRSRESTPAKEAASAAVSEGSGRSLAPVSRSDSDGRVTGRAGVLHLPAPTTRERETVEKMRNGRPTGTELQSRPGVSVEDILSVGGTPGGERQSREAVVTSRDTSPARKAVDDLRQEVAFSSQEVKRHVDSIPSKVERSGTEEIPKESVLQRNGAGVREELTHRKSPHKSVTASERDLGESGQICTENDSYSKKTGKLDIKNVEGQQRSGGRHGRRKKGHNASARIEERLGGEAREVCSNAVKPDAEGDVRIAAKVDTPENISHEEVHPAESTKQKPQLLAPPEVPQCEQAPEPSSTAPAVRPTENKPEEPKAPQVIASDSRAEPPQGDTAPNVKPELIPKECGAGRRIDDDGLNFLMSLRGQKAGGVSEVEAVKSATGVAVSKSAIEEDELKESQKPKPPPVTATEKKEDLEDWLDSMLDD